MGWSLSAVSSIERCERTKHQDGNAAPVDLTVNDKFCIGGSRLRLVSGTYGSNGSVYYTEVADYSRITAAGVVGSGPDHFTVEAKSGLKYEYGNIANARVVVGGSVLRWMLNRVYDRSGNSYVVSYNNLNGFAVPDVISWTPVTQGVSTYRYEAKFNYINNRTDTDSYIGKVAGNDVSNKYRLETIQIKNSGSIIRKYRFTYDTAPVTSRSRLTSAKDCADDAETNCLLALSFSYQAGIAGVTVGAVAAPAGSSNGLMKGRYDFNGDGRDDILYLSGSTWYAAFGANAGFSGPYNTGVTGGALVDQFLPAGRDAIASIVGGQLWVSRWDDATSSFVGFNTGVSSVLPNAAADYDGDGLADLVSYVSNTPTMTIRRNNSTGASNPSFESGTSSLSPGGNNKWGGVWSYFGNGLQRADVNGDGRQDLYVVVVTPIYNGQQQVGAYASTAVILGSSTGFTFASEPWVVGGSPAWPSLNFNGDRCTDRLVGAVVYIAQCNGSSPSSVTVPATPLFLLDWDGDGKTDFLVNNGGNFGVYRSTGAGFGPMLSTSVSSTGTFYALDLDGDHLEDLVKLNGTSAISYWTHTANGSVPATFATNVPDLLASVTDGYGVTVTPNYMSTSWGSYDKGAATSFPLQEADSQMVVAQVTKSNGIGGTFNETFQYVGARMNSVRSEFAGYQRIEMTDSRTGIVQKTYSDQVFPNAGMVSQVDVLQPGGVTLISRKVFTNTYATLDATTNNQRYFPYTSGGVTSVYEYGGAWNGSLLSTENTSILFDTTSGTPYDITSTSTEPASGANGLTAGGSWTSRTYLPLAYMVNDSANWCLGRPGQTQKFKSHKLTYGGSIQQTSSTSWNPTFCRPSQTIDEPDSGTLKVTTDYAYDAFGNISTVTVAGVGMTSRTSTVAYSNATFTTGQFPLSSTNALGETAYTTWNYNFGVPISVTDSNGLSQSWQYDLYGRRTREDRADGTATTWSYNDCAVISGGCVNSNNKIISIETALASGGGYVNDAWTYLDALDRPIITTTRTAGGSYNRVDREYDSMGRVYRESAPCIWATCTQYWTTTSYDIISRPATISRPISDSNPSTQSMTFSYEGLSSRVYDPQGKFTLKTMSANGGLRRSMDHDYYYQEFEYDALGNPKRVSDQNGNTLQTADYNLRGMLTQRTDMSLGGWSFTPDALGQVVSQTDANGQTSTFIFDQLGHMTARSETEEASSWV